MIKAIVFDMDDTLYLEKDYVFSGFNHIDNWLKYEFQVEGFSKIAINLFESGENKLVFNKTLDYLKVTYDDKFIQQMIKLYRSHTPIIKLCEDTKWLFDKLNNKVKLGLISDGYYEAQSKKVAALGLNQIIETIILTDTLGREQWKPSKVPYEVACNELQVAHNECIYIGDNEKKDFITAKKLGWTTVHVEREKGIYFKLDLNEDYSAHYKVTSLRELEDLPILRHLFLKKAERM
ncbi:HAD family hydrolase [Bacillus sp. F19]|nr:HAD family hydrolase [Bacillus sp. F19]